MAPPKVVELPPTDAFGVNEPPRNATPFCALTPLIADEPGIGMPLAVVLARPAQAFVVRVAVSAANEAAMGDGPDE